jgi:hypothetical protein
MGLSERQFTDAVMMLNDHPDAEIMGGKTWAQQDQEVCDLYRRVGINPPQALWFGDLRNYLEERYGQRSSSTATKTV